MSEEAKRHLQAFLATLLAIVPAFPLSCLSQKNQTLVAQPKQTPCEVPGASPSPGTFDISPGEHLETARR